MIRFGKWVARHRVLILVVSALLLVPAFLSMNAMRVNYDILVYLPSEIETMRGQDILTDEFGTGAFAFYMVEGMDEQDVANLKKEIEGVAHVKSVIWKDDVMDLSIPSGILPDKLSSAFNYEDTTMMVIFFDETSSAEGTLQAVGQIRALSSKECFLSGMSPAVLDTKNLAEDQEPVYVGIAVVCSAIVMALFLDSFIMPLFFLLSIGMAIIYNLGTNFFLGEISYITKAISAVLQLGVTMDYSIFLWHSYQEQLERFQGENERAMAHAIKATFTSVLGSSITTVAGFLALCFMRFTLGTDLGLVLAKGVCFGVLSCITILPAMILVFEKVIHKTMHRSLMPNFNGVCGFITRHYKVIVCAFAVLLVPMIYGYAHMQVYYKMDESLPRDLDSIQANQMLKDDFGLSTTHMVLIDKDLSEHDKYALVSQMEQVPGVNSVLGIESIKGPAVPADIIPEKFRSLVQSDAHELMLVNSAYEIASDEVNGQIDTLNEILHTYDERGMLIGEAPLTKDLIDITDQDFQWVSVVSIGAIFLIILFVLRSFSLPVLLVATIESAIFINLGIPYYAGSVLPFVAGIVISTIQLGATVDYAILMTTRYIRERSMGAGKRESVVTALRASISSIIVSALGFFAATFGVGVYSDIDIIASLCMLMSRGAIISMAVVIFILPALLLIFDRIIVKTTVPLRKANAQHKEAAAQS